MIILLGMLLVIALVLLASYVDDCSRLKRQVTEARLKRYAAEAQITRLRAELERTAKMLDAEAARLRSPASWPSGQPR